jgi:hypothetical protein
MNVLKQVLYQVQDEKMASIADGFAAKKAEK